MSTVAEPAAEAPILSRRLKLVLGGGALLFLIGWVPNYFGWWSFWAARWPMFFGSVLVPVGIVIGVYRNRFDIKPSVLKPWRNPVVEALGWSGLSLVVNGFLLWQLGDHRAALTGLGVAALVGALVVRVRPRWEANPPKLLLCWTGIVQLARWLAAALVSDKCPPDPAHPAYAPWCVVIGLVIVAVWARIAYPLTRLPVWAKNLLLWTGAVLLGGGLLATQWNSAAWRWTAWLGLVLLTAWVVVRWCWPEEAHGDREPPPDPPVLGRTNQIEYFFAWVFAYPLLVLQLVFFCYISWGGFGEGLGLPDLVWGDEGWMQFWVGLAVSMLFCNVLFVRALLDRRPGIVPPRVDSNWSLFWFVRKHPPVRPKEDATKWTRWGTWVAIAVTVVLALVVEYASAARARWLLTGPLMIGAGALVLQWIRVLNRTWENGPPAGAPEGTPPPAGAGPDQHIHQVGAFLLRYWFLALAAFYLPKLVAWEQWRRTETGWMPVGLLTGVLVTLIAVALYEFWVRPRWSNSRVFNALVRMSAIHPRYHQLHALAVVLTAAIPGAALCLLLYELAYFDAVWAPVWLVCLFLALFNSAYGFVAFHFAGLQYVTTGLLVLILLVANCDNEYKMSHPGLEDYDHPCKRPDLDAKVPDKPPFLIETRELLKANRTKWAGGPEWQYNPFNDHKPKVVIVATTGGGIQASVWTALVLDGLQNDEGLQAREFHKHIRLMTGASGGMQGAGLYAGDFGNAHRPRHQLDAQMARDSLWPTLQTMLTHDLPGALTPRRFATDRGRRLEEAWWANAPLEENPGQLPRWVRDLYERPKPTRSPLEMTFRDLRAAEAACDRPVLVFSPMMVEDCRRVMISNLSLDWFTATTVQHQNPELKGRDGEPYPNVADLNTISVPALEFWRYFPVAHDKFKVSTAARMSATFPFVGPAVSLPTNPPRRVVDAGYFDNFGINFVSMWLHHHKKEFLEHTSGVVIVEIRAYPRREEKLRYKVTQPDGTEDKGDFLWAASELSSPLEAIYNLYARSAYFRNDQLLHMLDESFNNPRNPKQEGPAPLPFFTVATFECPQPAALSWNLPRRNFEELKTIVAAPKPGELLADIGDGTRSPTVTVDKGSANTIAKLSQSRAQWVKSVRFLREWFAGDPIKRKP